MAEAARAMVVVAVAKVGVGAGVGAAGLAGGGLVVMAAMRAELVAMGSRCPTIDRMSVRRAVTTRTLHTHSTRHSLARV